jgi:hypothetical protein
MAPAPAPTREEGPSSEKSGVETFVWRESGRNSSNNNHPCWTVRHRKSSKIYDSDPHSLKIPRSHNAWKNELMMTRFANQELPEALWGDSFLEISYGQNNSENNNTGNKTDNNSKQNHRPRGVRISFCAMEALRTWALMDMDVERKKNDGMGANSNAKSETSTPNKTSKIGKEEGKNLPKIIPHKSGRTPDPWDYTYTTNYSGSVECTGYSSNIIGDGSFQAKQPDQTTLYSIKVLPSQESSSSSTSTLSPLKTRTGSTLSTVAPGTTATEVSSGDQQQQEQFLGGGGSSAISTVELRPPMCKCVGGRMICAGVAQTLTHTTRQPLRKAVPIRLPKLQFSSKTSSSPSTKIASARIQTQTPKRTPKPSPKWMPYCRDTDGPFDMEALLNSQTSAPLHYTGTVPFWIQNLDPHSYSFLTVTAVVCDGGGNDNGKTDGGFLAVLLRCFVRVNCVKVRLVDTKFVIRCRESSDSNKSNSKSKSNNDRRRQLPPMVVLRERSWKEGTWEEYTSGMKGDATNGNYHFLGTDLEQGKRAAKTLPDRFPPIVDKLVLCDDEDDDREKESCEGCSHDGESTSCSDNREPNGTMNNIVIPGGFAVTKEEWKIPALHGGSVSNCAGGSRILVAVVEERKLVALDALSGKFLWDHNLTSSLVLSLAVRDSSLSHPDKVKVVVGDDRGCAQVIEWNGDAETEGGGKLIVSEQSYYFDSSNERYRKHMANVQRPSNWVETVAWSPNGRYFAAAAGKKIMINGKVLELEGTVYDLAFLPTSHHGATDTGGNTNNQEAKHDLNSTRQLLAIALYGGLTIVDAADMTVWHRRFTVGSSAVLSFAVSPNGRSIGIGCLDKRLRVFEPSDTEAAIAKGGGDHGRFDTSSFGIFDHWDARDWIGFDGGVASVAFGPDNRRWAALGGSSLLVIDRTSEWGEAPTICSIRQDRAGGRGREKGDRFQSFAWKTKDILVASTNRFLYVFDVRVTIDTVPKRSYPVASIPIEKGFLVTDRDGEIIMWGKSGIFKIKINP